MNSFEVALRTKQLPEKIEELIPMMFAGQAAVKFMAAKLKAVSDKNLDDPLGILEQQRKNTVEDGQCMGEMLLRVMGRIGELSETIPNEQRGKYIPVDTKRAISNEGKGRGAPIKAAKMVFKDVLQLKQAQFIKNHPDIVDRTIAECKENDDIPNIAMVIKQKRIDKLEKERKDRSQPITTKMDITLDEQEYLLNIESALRDIPKEPPQKCGHDFIEQAIKYWMIIAKRGQHFGVSINIDKKLLGGK